MVSAGLVVVGLLAAPASATTFGTVYGWEDGVNTILGSYGNLTNPLNVTEPPGHVHKGLRALQVTEAPHSGTPQAYLAFIEGLTDGDIIDASFFGWDDTPGLSPSLRIWAHYAVSGDITSYNGSAGGNSTYSAGTGWSKLSHSWTFDSSLGTRDALVIEARLYSYPGTDPTASTDYWIDNLSVSVTTNHPDVFITTPRHTVPEPTTLAFLALGGLALIRRR
jgi:hypothetical protein